jgi:hypothetical protein
MLFQAQIGEESDMPKKTTPQDGQANKEKRIDDLEAALEESEEQNAENQVVDDAEANQEEPSTDWTEKS